MSEYIPRKQNRTTTFTSLCAVVGLIYARNETDFCRAYKTATHDTGGHDAWYRMHYKAPAKQKENEK